MRTRFVLFLPLVLFLCVPQACLAQEPDFVDHIGLLKIINNSKGRVVVINFWATWCGACRIEFKELATVRREFPEDDLLMLGISMDEDPAAYKNFLRKTAFNYPVYLGAKSVCALFRVEAIPKLMIYNKRGALALSHEGFLSSSKLSRIITELRAE
ncbi:MAG: TlpA disulfide reductase family protein [Thermodesulfobacteriota bacterium]|nr:TlpA disulfide reductase family protein [Thermodesulfobacteriota bacterium]